MKCPVCQVNLLMSTRQDVEIDYCPQCRGIWLDRGELDKIIEKSRSFGASAYDQPKDQKSYKDSSYKEERYSKGYESESLDPRQGGYKPYKKKKPFGSFIEDLFDFGD